MLLGLSKRTHSQPAAVHTQICGASEDILVTSRCICDVISGCYYLLWANFEFTAAAVRISCMLSFKIVVLYHGSILYCTHGLEFFPSPFDRISESFLFFAIMTTTERDSLVRSTDPLHVCRLKSWSSIGFNRIFFLFG